MNLMQPHPDHLIWVDLEMTGLDPINDKIIEMAVVITDTDLNVIAQGPVFAIHQSDEILEKMDAWNTSQHTGSGLLERVRASEVTEQEAQESMLDFIMTYVPPQKSPMCGNSICQDRRFLARYMPILEKYFHYRNLDVSVLSQLKKRWRPDLKEFKKSAKHLALADILESIEELKYYRSCFLKSEA